MSNVARRVRAAVAAAAVGWLGGCSDNPGGPVCCTPPEGLVVSDPSAVSGLAAGTAALALTSAAGDSVVYVSLPPGTAPGGGRAVIRRAGDAGSLTAAVFDGGFDPVPVAAQAGDSIEVVVLDAGGATVYQQRVAVRPRRPPIVVRTDPPPDKTDVPVNAAIVMVFSEPVDAATLTPSSVQLFRLGSPVSGTAFLLQGSATAALFVPEAPLAMNADYQLVVRQGVRDLGGDALGAAVTVDFTTGTSVVERATRVVVLPDTVAVAIGSQVKLTAVARDTNGTPIVGRPVIWLVDNPAVASVSVTGLVTGLTEGVATVRAQLDGRSGQAAILVSPLLAPVESVEITPVSATVLIGGLVQLRAVLRDAAGNVLPFRSVSWQSSNPAAVAVSSGQSSGTAVATRVSSGTATITATSEGKRGTATITDGTVGPYAQLSAGNGLTCAVTTAADAWCWGSGPTGNGTGLSTLVPAGVAGELSFSRVSAGWDISCALIGGGAAYCWGYNRWGALGSGDTTTSSRPVTVAGGNAYSAISVSTWGQHVCALASGGEAYCWGWNKFGVLGLGTTAGPAYCAPSDHPEPEPCSTEPVAVLGGHTFTALAAGAYHTCALTATGAAYCWGRGDAGALGDSTLFDRSAPVPVVGGRSFVALTTGGMHTCGLTSDGAAYCWGGNYDAQLGIGTVVGPDGPCQSPVDPNRGVAHCSTGPVPVLTPLRFSSISAGGDHTCALTPAGAAYCWGRYWLGNSVTPTLVAGGPALASLSSGGGHSCGLTLAGIAYCLGANNTGQLGNGTTTPSNLPVRVAGQP